MRLFLSTVATLLIACSTFSAAPTYNPQNLIIATDLDDVVLRRRNGRIAAIVCKNLHRLIPMYANFRRHKKIGGETVGQRYGEGFYLYLVAQDKHKLAKIVKKICTKKRLKTKTVKIMKKMVGQGYTIYTATNIGTLFFPIIQKKFADIFNDNFIRNGMTVDYTQQDVIEKPDPRYFEELKKRLNPDNDKHILFIDDRLENVEAARAAGLLAIHFEGHKQLRAELRDAYGICA